MNRDINSLMDSLSNLLDELSSTLKEIEKHKGSRQIKIEIEVSDTSYTSEEIIDIISRALGEAMVKDFKISSFSEIVTEE